MVLTKNGMEMKHNNTMGSVEEYVGINVLSAKKNIWTVR